MLDYARYDSHYLIAIYAIMMKILAPSLFFNEGQILGLDEVLNEDIIKNSESSTNWVQNLQEIQRSDSSVKL